MNPFDTIRTERPPVESITARRRTEVRELLLGLDDVDDAPHSVDASANLSGPNIPSDDQSQLRPRRLLVLAAAAIIAIGVAGLVVTFRDPSPTPVVNQPSVPTLISVPTSDVPAIDDAGAIAPPATLPLPIERTGGSVTQLDDSDTSGPGDDVAADELRAFTPLILSAPPDGFVLFSATYTPGAGGFGIARYRSPETTTELHLIVRDDAEWDRPLIDLGRATTDVDGRMVYASGEGNGDCLSDVCQIDLQFDDRAGVSIMWVTVDATPLREGSTRDALFPLVSTLVADPSAWTAHTGETQFPLPTSDVTPLLVPFGPGEARETSTVFVGPPGSSVLILRAPDGSVKSLLINVGADAETIDGPDDRRFGDAAVTLVSEPSASEFPVYRATHQCWTMQVSDGSRWTDGAWSEATVNLFDSATFGDTGVVFDLAAGWEVVAASEPDLLYEMQFSVPQPGGGRADVTVLQAAGQHAYAAAGLPSNLTPFESLGPGWSSDPAQPEPAQVLFEANGWSYIASSSELASGDLMDLLTSMTAISVDGWVAEFGALDVPDNELALDGDCAVPVLAAD